MGRVARARDAQAVARIDLLGRASRRVNRVIEQPVAEQSMVQGRRVAGDGLIGGLELQHDVIPGAEIGVPLQIEGREAIILVA